MIGSNWGAERMRLLLFVVGCMLLKCYRSWIEFLVFSESSFRFLVLSLGSSLGVTSITTGVKSESRAVRAISLLAVRDRDFGLGRC